MAKENTVFPFLAFFIIGIISSVYSQTEVVVKAKRCPFPLSYRTNAFGQNFGNYLSKLAVSSDESSRQLTSCRVLNGNTYFIGRSYLNYNFYVNGTWFEYSYSCYIKDAEDKEVVFQGNYWSDNVQFLYTSTDNSVIWVEKNKIADWPKVSPVPAQTASSKTKVKNATPGNLFVARCRIELEDGINFKLPGVVYEADLSTAYVTYDNAVYSCTDYEVPICV